MFFKDEKSIFIYKKENHGIEELVLHPTSKFLLTCIAEASIQETNFTPI